ncbi:hypothetical protein CDL12_18803 [Handroanthus impetiginosus]|uniref:Uncharacterized protein n=1 Tax=Handroanthus impetiginosus TaxID=429701 RepID=A0A2G9GTR9_9LAMI|nr:hypothetical protein CDL12_18803 [Handroanthus impetiginosus]
MSLFFVADFLLIPPETEETWCLFLLFFRYFSQEGFHVFAKFYVKCLRGGSIQQHYFLANQNDAIRGTAVLSQGNWHLIQASSFSIILG